MIPVFSAWVRLVAQWLGLLGLYLLMLALCGIALGVLIGLVTVSVGFGFSIITGLAR